MKDEDADLIQYFPKENKKLVHVYPGNQYYDKLKSAYPDYYEEGCDCLIFPYDVWQSIEVS